MPDSRLIAVITALSMLGMTSDAQAAFTISQLREIERLITDKDCGALRGYITRNPGLAEGNDPLAVELRNFVNRVDNGLIDCLGASSRDARVALEPDGDDSDVASFSEQGIY